MNRNIYVVGKSNVHIDYQLEIIEKKFESLSYFKSLDSFLSYSPKNIGCTLVDFCCFERSSAQTVRSTYQLHSNAPLLLFTSHCLFSPSESQKGFEGIDFLSLPDTEQRILKYLGKAQGISKFNMDSINTAHEARYKCLCLSTREKQIFMLITDGYSSKQVADQLFRSIGTVDFHKKSIKEKLNAPTLAELIEIRKLIVR